MNIVSLFDGISCGYVALENIGIEIESYSAYEIDKHAIYVSNFNHKKIKHYGSVIKADFTVHKDIDLLLAGSPCQGFSINGKQLNFEDSRSKLYFDFERAIDEINPKYWLLENVSMKNEYRDIISRRLGVEPITINSELVSAQSRKRLYWTNIQGVEQPSNTNITLNDIVHENNGENFDNNLKFSIEHTLSLLDYEEMRHKLTYQGQDDYNNDMYSFKGQMIIINSGNNKTNKTTNAIAVQSPYRIRKQGGPLLKTEKAFTLTCRETHGVLINGYMRSLSITECERLQTLPDGYTSCTSKNQAKIMLGNAWNVKTIEHILSYIK